MNDELQMNAYYYSFEPTGCLTVDKILSAVAVAGKKYHYTEAWENSDDGEDTCVDVIQKMANESAQYVTALEERLAILEAAVAFKGFDELPKPQKNDVSFCVKVQLRGGCGTVSDAEYKTHAGTYRIPDYIHQVIKINQGEDYLDNSDNNYTARQLSELGFTGWRYPVGDLSE